MSKESAKSTSTSGLGVFGSLGVLFVGLKLTGYIGWSWWWVTLPFWWWVPIFVFAFLCLWLLWLCGVIPWE